MLKICTLCILVIGMLMFAADASSSDDGGDSKNKKENMEHIFPLLFLMSGAPSVHSPGVWLMGALSLGVMLFLGRSYGLGKMKTV